MMALKSSLKWSFLCLAAAAFGASACGDDDDAGGIGGTGFTVHGHVVEAGSNGSAGTPLSGVDVSLGIDLNGDGALAENESAHGTTDDNGDYSVGVSVAAGDRVVVAFRSEGLASQFRTIVANGDGEAILNISLNALESLSCEGTVCALDGNKVRITGLPEGATGSAQVFNPVAQPEAFPGGFEESTGSLLVSGVFSAVELTDSNGAALHELATPATLRMALPADTWGIVIDIAAATDRIEVPLYSFDEGLGTWVRDGEGYLEDSAGAIIPEADLASIRDGSFVGAIYATGEVTHFSYWNVDWPIESHGCVTGLITDAAGNPAVGATVSVRGTTYNGTSSPQTTDASGRFCVDVMRSEGAGEDLDQDGVTGETHGVAIRVVYEGEVYEGGSFSVGAAQATCSEGGCTDIGTIALTEANKLQVSLCTISGTIVDLAGNPMPGATLYANDETLESEMLYTVCGEYLENCTYYATADTDGSFTVTTGMLDGMTLWAYSSTTDEAQGLTRMRYGERWMQQCPAADATTNLTLDDGYDSYDLTIEADGDQISWSPNIPVELFYVVDGATSDYNWMISSIDDLSGFTGPLTYGTIPEGAEQIAPYDGSAPPALASGDELEIISSNGVSEDGYLVLASGSGVVP